MLIQNLFGNGDGIFANGSFGGAVQNGYLNNAPPDRKNLGRRILFRESLENRLSDQSGGQRLGDSQPYLECQPRIAQRRDNQCRRPHRVPVCRVCRQISNPADFPFLSSPGRKAGIHRAAAWSGRMRDPAGVLSSGVPRSRPKAPIEVQRPPTFRGHSIST